MGLIRHILFPYDFSAQATETLPYVRALAMRFDARVTLFSVVPPTWELPPQGMRPLAGDSPREWVHALQDRLDHSLIDEFGDVRVDRIADGGDPAFRIAAFAANQIDLVMMPTHGLGAFRRFLVGSVTSKVLHDVTCPVWTAAHAETQLSAHVPRRILCAVDGTSKSAALLQWADAFCHGIEATLKILHVVEPMTDWPGLERERRLQEQVRQEARADLERTAHAVGIETPVQAAVGEIVDTVVEEVRQEQADLVIIGRGSINEPFGGLRTNAFGIVQRSPCPVVSV